MWSCKLTKISVISPNNLKRISLKENPPVNIIAKLPARTGWIWVLSRDQTEQNIGSNTVAGEEGNILLFSAREFGEAKSRA